MPESYEWGECQYASCPAPDTQAILPGAAHKGSLFISCCRVLHCTASQSWSNTIKVTLYLHDLCPVSFFCVTILPQSSNTRMPPDCEVVGEGEAPADAPAPSDTAKAAPPSSASKAAQQQAPEETPAAKKIKVDPDAATLENPPQSPLKPGTDVLPQRAASMQVNSCQMLSHLGCHLEHWACRYIAA